MTGRERAALWAARPEVVTTWRMSPDVGFVELVAGPCPYFDGACTVYDVRPYNCRRYLCGREDGEPWADGAVPVRFLTDPGMTRLYARNQAAAQGWAVAHGWVE